MAIEIRNEPLVRVGILDREDRVEGRLHGVFSVNGFDSVTDFFSARAERGAIILLDGAGRELARSGRLKIEGAGRTTFDLFHVTIGSRFHWERTEDQTFEGSLTLLCRGDGTMAVINEIPLERYLESVISSEMNASAPAEFLKSHAILSRSWILRALGRKGVPCESPGMTRGVGTATEVLRWYGREEHDLFDVCADDHCQRYHGVTKITSDAVGRAVGDTRGTVLTYGGEVCDARYSKACGGLTEEFQTAWEAVAVPYLVSIPDGPASIPPVSTEEQARAWVLSAPAVHCNTKDRGLLETVLPAFDLETHAFFRWTVGYAHEDLEEILYEKSGLDFGRLLAIVPLARGPSGRIFRLRVVGSKLAVTVGKELEIRRWLSRSHLYSSAFTVEAIPASGPRPERFVFRGAGWGHGVGLCQIGAAFMASRGSGVGQIMGHYFPHTALSRLY